MRAIPNIPPPDKVPCPEDFAAYLDGELNPNEELNFEAHLAVCAECRAELNRQKAFMSVLDGALDDELPRIDPEKLTRSIVVKAESSVSGLRSPKERLTAALICLGVLALAAVTIAVIGGGVSTEVNSPIDRAGGIASAVGHLIYNIALSFSVVIRAVTSDVSIVRTLWAGAFVVGLLGLAYRIRGPIMQRIFRSS